MNLDHLSTILWVLFFTSLLLLAYTYVGYPFVIGILARVAPRPHLQKSLEPVVSLIILAHNEERHIAAKLDNTLSLDYPHEKIEIVVASDGSTDRTDEIVESYADRGIRLFRAEDHPGKTETTNRAIPTTRGEILIFSDATGRFRHDSVRALVQHFADPDVGAVVGRVAYRYGSSVASRGFMEYQRYVVSVRRMESAFGTGTTASGSICAIRRGAFRPIPGELDFDMAHPLHVALDGRRTIYEPEAVSEEEAREEVGGEFSARVRMAIQAFTFLPYLLRRLPSCRNRLYVFQVISLKVLRWISPMLLFVLLLTSVLLATGSRLALGLLLLQITVYVAAVVAYASQRSGFRLRVLGLPLFFVTINLAFLFGFVRWLRGARIAVWTPER